MSQRFVVDQLIPIETDGDRAATEFVISEMTGSRPHVADSEDRMLIHRAWVQGDWIAAEVEQYGPDEPEPTFHGQLSERNASGRHRVEDPPTDAR